MAAATYAQAHINATGALLGASRKRRREGRRLTDLVDVDGRLCRLVRDADAAPDIDELERDAQCGVDGRDRVYEGGDSLALPRGEQGACGRAMASPLHDARFLYLPSIRRS